MTSLKDQVLGLLAAHPDQPCSGEQIAEQFQVSRAAVWKVIDQLRNDGIEIEASPRIGYRFLSGGNGLSAPVITAFSGKEADLLTVFPVIDSTNNEAKRMLTHPVKSGSFIIANQQTAGRGRRTHTFASPENTGIYCSYIFHPQALRQEELLKITVAAAVASVRAIRSVSRVTPQIKWVNDLFYGGKKIGGILTEAISDFESREISSVIIGIGINCASGGIPDELKEIAGGIDDPDLDRNKLAASLWNELDHQLKRLSDPALMDDYRNASMVIGKTIEYTDRENKKTGTVIAINEEGNLVVDLGNCTDILTAGEISVKLPKNG